MSNTGDFSTRLHFRCAHRKLLWTEDGPVHIFPPPFLSMMGSLSGEVSMRHILKANCMLLGLALLALAGCLPPESGHLLVNDNPFGSPAVTPAPSRSAFPPGSTEAGSRVDALARKIIAANPQMGIKPIVITIGTNQPEIFHRGTAEIDITDGMINQCRTEGALAAVLCAELGKMISEREAIAPHHRVTEEREPPPAVQFSGDTNGDIVRQAELAKYCESDRRRRMATPALPPDPQVLARDYLTKAGFQPNEMDGVAALLRSAAGNSKFEKQFTAPGPARPWTE
jgi:hypothetical protein